MQGALRGGQIGTDSNALKTSALFYSGAFLRRNVSVNQIRAALLVAEERQARLETHARRRSTGLTLTQRETMGGGGEPGERQGEHRGAGGESESQWESRGARGRERGASERKRVEEKEAGGVSKGREILRSRGRAAQMGDEEEEEARAVSRGSLAALVRHLGTPRPRDRPACAPRRASSARVHIELQER
ncbi:unnamed protein product [Lampetra fluviatilis]